MEKPSDNWIATSEFNDSIGRGSSMFGGDKLRMRIPIGAS